MTMSDRSITVAVADDYASAMGRDAEYDVWLNYAEEVDKTVLSRGKELSLDFPLENADELSAISQIEDQIAKNQSRVNYNYDIECAFDAAVLDMLHIAIAEDLSLDDFNIDEKKLKVIILRKARCDTYKDIVKHLSNNKHLTNKIGIEKVPAASTICGWTRDLEANCSSLSSVIVRLVHAAYRNGVSTPEDTKSQYNLGVSDAINADNLSLGVENRALINWCDEILDKISDPITFNRAENISYHSDEIVGASALAALINSPSSAPIFGSWIFDPDDIVGDHIYGLIKKLNMYEINEVFREVNYNIVNYASQVGFFNKSQNIGLDTTWINWDGKEDNFGNLTINNPKRCQSGNGWCFAAIALMSSKSRFTFGIDIVGDKSNNVDIFRRQLRQLTEAGIDIDRLHADREFYSGDAIKMARSVAGDNFAIRVKLNKKGRPPEVIKSMNLDPGQAKIQENVEFAQLESKPNVCGQRVPEKSDKDSEYMGFLTDLTEDDIHPRSIYYTYNQRWSIEAFFNQLKNGMAPKTKTPDPRCRLFFLNLGTVFHNIHVLINNARSPRYGFCLDVPYYQILAAIVFSVFDVQIDSHLK